MWKQRLCLSTSGQFNVPETEQIRLFKEAGFDGFFTCYDKNKDFDALVKAANEHGMYFQSIHAPYLGAKDIWFEGKKGDAARDELIDCVRTAAKYLVPIVVMHAYIGFKDPKDNVLTKEEEHGFVNFQAVVSEAKKLGVKIAFENTEGMEYLDALMNYFKNEENVGFCWDTGHEMCYNYSERMLDKYGKRLFCTHLNDNLGIKDYDGKITWLDDLHLLPFDGIADWQDITQQLVHYNFHSELTFELNLSSKPDRHDNDLYGEMDLKQYLALAFARACKVASLKLQKEALKK